MQRPETTIVRVTARDFADRNAERDAGELRLRSDLLTANRAELHRDIEALLEQYKTLAELFAECNTTRQQLLEVAQATEKEPDKWCGAVKAEIDQRLANSTKQSEKCYASLKQLQSSTTLPPQRVARLERLLSAAPVSSRAARSITATRIEREPLETDYEEIEM